MADIQAGLTGEEFLSYQQKALDYLYDMPLGNDSLFIAKPDNQITSLLKNCRI